MHRMDRRTFCYGLLATSTAASARLLPLPGKDAEPVASSVSPDLSGRLHFVLNNPLQHPFYWWPRTLLGYRVQFSKPVESNRLMLMRVDTGEQTPLQLTEVEHSAGGIRAATVHFFADLPVGARSEFVLNTSGTAETGEAQVRESRENQTIVLDTGAMRVRIPATQDVHGDAPGPVMQVSRGGPWAGSSSLHITGDRISRITSTRTESGPLFITYEIAYETESGSRYVATVQAAGGHDFIRLRENMEGLKPGASGEFRIDWDEFNATHRQAPNHPFPLPDQILNYDDYPWERVDASWFAPDVHYGSSLAIYPDTPPKGELPFTLGIYQTWTSFETGNFANFWDEHTGNALGVFIDDPVHWQDHEYAYELESPTLQVRFCCDGGKFFWKWPLARGSRSVCLAYYPHEKDKEAMREMEQGYRGVKQDGFTYEVPLACTSHTLFLQNRYGTLDLNRVKDWVLDYPEDAKYPAEIFSGGEVKNADELERSVMTSQYVTTLPLLGARQSGGHGPIPNRSIVNFSPVPARRLQTWWVDGFNRLRSAMTPQQARRLTAMYLLMGYVHAGEDFMPVVPMLGGHPNFLADVKAVSPLMSFLFPEHPMAPVWVDMWQKSMEINMRYNTRPRVEAWDACGGRWTESLGTYVWAFLRPSLRTDFLIRKFDGTTRFATPQLADLCDWLVNALSAPFNGETPEAMRHLQEKLGHLWGIYPEGNGPRRVYPTQGAHAERHLPPRSLWYLGTCLHRYAPLAAEYAMWAARPANQDMEAPPGNLPPWDDIMYEVPDNHGTNPHLQSRKYTGYGIVLRAAVGQPEEVSIHLQQIDEGPNYRWGHAAEGGCGAIYYFAAGKAYGYNGQEDAGDRQDQDTDFCSNGGVYIHGDFRAVGQNVLDRPFYDLGVGQFAEVVPRQAPTSYSAPEYISRNVLLAGHDYFLLNDCLLNPDTSHRLSWFVRRGDNLPSIQIVRGESSSEPRSSQRTNLETVYSRGVWIDGRGDSMAVVSHRTDLKTVPTSFGCRVQTDDVDDLVFRNPKPIEYGADGYLFAGTAGLIRRNAAHVEFALFHGTAIGCPGFSLHTQDADLGISCTSLENQRALGEYYAPAPSSLTIRMAGLSAQATVYVDGEALNGRRNGEQIEVSLKRGKHRWELTDKLPAPMAPRILRTENHDNGARVVATGVAAAARYRFELSRDDGSTWSAIGEHEQPEIDITGLGKGTKVHVRAVALNSARESLPGPEYPVYVTNEPPLPPDGLHVELAEGAAHITWGEVLGVGEYRLYARLPGNSDFQPLYHGRERSYDHWHAGIRAADSVPRNSNAAAQEHIQYCVASFNGNGEGPRSRVVTSDSGAWLNWDPRPGERFRRVYSYPPHTPPSPDERPRYYPL